MPDIDVSPFPQVPFTDTQSGSSDITQTYVLHANCAIGDFAYTQGAGAHLQVIRQLDGDPTLTVEMLSVHGAQSGFALAGRRVLEGEKIVVSCTGGSDPRRFNLILERLA